MVRTKISEEEGDNSKSESVFVCDTFSPYPPVRFHDKIFKKLARVTIFVHDILSHYVASTSDI